MTETPPLVAASVWEQDLYTHLAAHIENERAVLEDYADAAAVTDSKAFAYLVNLLIDDERRHHRAFASLAASLKTEAELGGSDPEIPYMDFQRADRAQVRYLTEQLLRRERDDAKELKRLHAKLHDVRDTSLWDVLIGTMRRDTDKHIAVLEFVLRHTPPAPK